MSSANCDSIAELSLEPENGKVLDDLGKAPWPAYSEYKNSGVDWLGDIPEQWKLKRLKFAVNLVNEKVESVDTELPYFGLENIESWTGRKIQTESQPEGVANRFDIGDVLFGKLRPYLAKAYHAQAEGGLCTGEALVLRQKDLVPRYLLYFLLSKDFINIVDSSTYGAKMPRANWDFIGNLPTLLPEVGEQTAIASFLDRETARIDALIAKKQRLIELLQEKRTALISQAVTKGLGPGVPMKDSGGEWLGEIPAHWEVKRIKNLLKAKAGAIKTGPFGSQLLSSEMYSGDVKVYNQRTVIDNDFKIGENYISIEKFEELKGFEIFPGDLMVTTRGTIGCCAIVPDEAEAGILHPCLMRLQINQNQAINEYVALLIQESRLVRDQLKFMSNATTIEVIYSESLKSVFLPMPPVGEQRKILELLEINLRHIEGLCSQTSKSLQCLQEYRTALISSAVTGKIDVR